MIECPAGWIRMMREDGDQRDGEFMTENQGCLPGHSQLCCPPNLGLLPTCGWYRHNNGRCEASCPSTHIEIGSINDHCRSGYQAACCSTAPQAIQLYTTCSWTKQWPDCNAGSCADKGSAPAWVEYASSGTGSGGAFCKEIGSRDIWGYPPKLTREQRKLCCREDIEEQRWTECEWYDRYGVIQKDWPPDACYGSCPPDKVRLAKDLDSPQCSQGARVRCCRPGYHTITKRENEASQEFRALLDRFMDNPRCSYNHSSDDYQYQERLSYHSKSLIFETPDQTRVGIWDEMVGAIYTNLKMAKVREWATTTHEALLLGNTGLPRAVMCGLAHYNAVIGGTAITCECYDSSCDGGVSKRLVIDHLLDDDIIDHDPIAAAFSDKAGNVTWYTLPDQSLAKIGLVKREGESYREVDVRSPITGQKVLVTLSMMAV
jgi:hypothetical protein